jgi:hypothetical protein
MWLILPLLVLIAAPAKADITHKLQTSIQLQVDGAASQATRIGSTYSVSGSNVQVTTGGNFGGLSALTAGSAVGYTSFDSELTTAGDAFTFSESFIEGDATPSATTVSNGSVGSLPALGNTTTTAGGYAGSLAGTIDSAGGMTLTAGGAGTTATGQFVSEITVK